MLTGPIKEIPREGTLLPETYHFTRGMTRERHPAHAAGASQRVAEGWWDAPNADLPLKSPEQLVIARFDR